MSDEPPAAPLDQPYRGSGRDRPTGVPFPPERMGLFRKWVLRKRWHYVSFWSPDLLLCAARVYVGPLANEYWGIWDRNRRSFQQRSHILRRRVGLHDDRLEIHDGDVHVEVPIEPDDEFEVYRPEGRAYIWSRKRLAAKTTATVRVGDATLTPEGTVFVDVNAGYHTRRTTWRWSAGAGVDRGGRLVAWNAITGLFDTLQHSERTIWIDGRPTEIGPVTFSDDLCAVSFEEGAELRFEQEADLRKRVGLFLIKSKYDHSFGSYTGTLPGGIELERAVGVRERQDALW
jgi:hypothetical protein